MVRRVSGSTRQLAALVWVVMLAASGCGQSRVEPGRLDSRASGVGGGPVVARVGRDEVSLEALAREVKSSGLTPDAALSQLVRRRLLSQEAQRQGFQDLPGVGAAGDRAAVRLLLERQVEDVEVSGGLSDGDVAQFYERFRDRFVQGERRTVTHVLFPYETPAPPGVREAALAGAKALLQRAHRLGPAEAFAEVVGVVGEGAARQEELGTFSMDAPFVQPFLEAAFSSDDAGVVSEWVETQFGVHVIWIKEIHPASVAPIEEVETVLRRELLVQRRTERLARELSRLRHASAIQVDETAWAQSGTASEDVSAAE